ncbi:ATP-grasp domain-containing protein [soil metagenome]
MNIAFVAVGRRVELVKSFRIAQQSLGIQGKLIGIDIDPLAPALQVCDDVRFVPRFDDPRFMLALVDICLSEQVDVMFPLIDPVIEVLAENRIELERTGAKVSVVSPESARIAADKLLVSAFFRGLGLSTPRTWDFEELDSREALYPLFIKPRRGSASRDAFKIRNAKELMFFREYVPDPIIQEFVPGPEITTDVVCDLKGAVLGIVSRRRIEVRAGEVSKGVTVHEKEIQDACVRIAEALPAVGPITVQCLVKDGRPLFTEINARLGGGIPLAIAAGLNVPALILAHLASIHMDVPELGSYVTGLHITRYDESFFVRDLDGVNPRRTK